MDLCVRAPYLQQGQQLHLLLFHAQVVIHTDLTLSLGFGEFREALN